jgi:peptidyl-prolyl cis-trans isomerase C/peptidyl-prolyl cis-trans isomerase D
MKFIIASLVLVAGFQARADVLATVGDAKITTEEFNRKLDEVRRQAMNPPTPDQFLEDLVRFEVGVQEAEKAKLQNGPIVKERYKQVLYNALLEKQIGKRVEDIKITENEMKDFYKKNPELRLSHILIEVKEGAKPEMRESVHKRALEILDDVKKSKRPFEELVKLYTDDLATKDAGGDIGFQSRVTLSPTLYDIAVNMKVGEVKGLIETPFGYHIIKLVDRRSFDLADKRQIRAAVFEEKRAGVFNDYFNKVKKQYKIQVHHELLKGTKH